MQARSSLALAVFLLGVGPRAAAGQPTPPTQTPVLVEACAIETAYVDDPAGPGAGARAAACQPGNPPPPPGLPPAPGCADLGAECGEVADGRGGVLDCGACAPPKECNVRRANKCDDPGPACREQDPEVIVMAQPPEVQRDGAWFDDVGTSAVCKMIGGALGLPLGDRTGYSFDVRKDKTLEINNRLCTETETATTAVNQAEVMLCGLGLRLNDSHFSDSGIVTKCKECDDVPYEDPDDPDLGLDGGVWVCDGERCRTDTSDNSFNFQGVWSFPSVKLLDVLTMNANVSAGARVDWWHKDTRPGTTDKCPTCQPCELKGWRAGPSLGGQLVIDAAAKQPWWLRWLGLQGSIDLQMSVTGGKETQHGLGAACPDKNCLTVRAQGSVTSRLRVTGRFARGIKVLTTLLNFRCSGGVEWDDCGGGLRWNPNPSCNFQ
jgi:hypothetical protein